MAKTTRKTRGASQRGIGTAGMTQYFSKVDEMTDQHWRTLEQTDWPAISKLPFGALQLISQKGPQIVNALQQQHQKLQQSQKTGTGTTAKRSAAGKKGGKVTASRTAARPGSNRTSSQSGLSATG